MNLLALGGDSVVRMKGDGGEFKFEVQHSNKKKRTDLFSMRGSARIIPWAQLTKDCVSGRERNLSYLKMD
jgi:hypothetical protein